MKKTIRKGLNSNQMSKLHWTLRKKGLSYKEALKETGKAKKLSKTYGNKKLFPGKIKGKDAYKDYDGDGKVNKYDCYPFDKRRQDDDGTDSWSDGYDAGPYEERKEREREEKETREKEAKELDYGPSYKNIPVNTKHYKQLRDWDELSRSEEEIREEATRAKQLGDEQKLQELRDRVAMRNAMEGLKLGTVRMGKQAGTNKYGKGLKRSYSWEQPEDDWDIL